jgi:hypothetical protein
MAKVMDIISMVKKNSENNVKEETNMMTTEEMMSKEMGIVETETKKAEIEKILAGAQVELDINGEVANHVVILKGYYKSLKNRDGEIYGKEPVGKIFVDSKYSGTFFGKYLPHFAWSRVGFPAGTIGYDISEDGDLVPHTNWWALASILLGSTEAAAEALEAEQNRLAENQEKQGYFVSDPIVRADGSKIYLAGRKGAGASYPYAQIQNEDGEVIGYAIWKFGFAPILVWKDVKMKDGSFKDIKLTLNKGDAEYPSKMYKTVCTVLCDIFERRMPEPTKKQINAVKMVRKASKVQAPTIKLGAIPEENEQGC